MLSKEYSVKSAASELFSRLYTMTLFLSGKMSQYSLTPAFLYFLSLRRTSIYQFEVSVSEVKNRDKDGKKIVRKVTETKTRNGDKALDILRELYDNIGRNQNSLVLLNENGNPVSYHALQRTHATICRHAGVVPWGLHTFRHLFASKCFANGVEVLALSKHLGHSNPTITLSTYAHLTEKQNDSFNQALERL